MQPPYALLRASINGGAVQTGGLVIAGSSTVQLSADPSGASDVSRYKYEILDYPTGWAVPAGWSTAVDGSYYYSGGAIPPVFTVGAAAAFGTYMLRLTVNNGISSNPSAVPASQLVDETTCVEVLSANGLRAVGWHETTQFGGLKDWIYKLSINWRLLDIFINGGGGGGGVTAHGALTGLSADDHTQYVLVSGTRAMTGALAMGAHKITGLATPTTGTDAATKAYVDSVVPVVTGVIRADGTVAFSAAQSMAGFKLTSLGTPTTGTDAATKAYVDLQIVPAGTNAFTGNQSLGGHKLTSVADPTSAQDAATKAYVDAHVGGGAADIAPVALATTGNITLSGEQTIDGTLTGASRVLVWKQSVASQNGIYVSAAGAWARANDQDASGDFRPSVFFVIAGGTENANKFAALLTPGAITVGTTAIAYAVTAGNVTSADAGLMPTVGVSSTVPVSSGTGILYALLSDANIGSAAAVAGTKISPDFGAQNIATTGTATAASVHFGSAAATPVIKQDDLTTNSGTGQKLTISAQNETGTTSTGGALDVGSGTGTSTHGTLSLKRGSTTIGSWSGTGTDFVQFGLPAGSGGLSTSARSSASVGTIRLYSAATINVRSWNDGADLQLFKGPTSTDNTLLLGDATTGNLGLQGGIAISFVVAGAAAASLNSGDMTIARPLLTFDLNQTSPVLSQSDLTGFAACNSLTVRAQKNVGASAGVGAGGDLICAGGDSSFATTTCTGGNFLGKGGSATSASGNRTGGDAGLQPGTGASSNGEAWIKDAGGTRQFRVNSTGIGFFAATPVAKPNVTGSRGSNAALAALLTALANLGLITDSST